MKKILMMLMLTFSMVIGANAQVANNDEYAFSSQKLLDNTYVGVVAGVTTPLDFNSVFPLNVNAGLKFGKNFNQVFGANVEGIAIFGDNNSDTRAPFGFIEPSKTFVKATNVGLNGTVNLTNLFLGYKENKVFTLSAEAGLGWLHMFPDNNGDGTDKNDLTAKTAVNFDWALGSEKAWHVSASPVIYWNLTRNQTGVQFNKEYAQLGVQVGLVYHFQTSNGTHDFKAYNVTKMNEQINSLIAENQALKNRKPQVVEKVVEKTVAAPVSNVYVCFAQNSAELTTDAKASLDAVNGTADIVATASPEGTEKYNKTLSDKRAAAVADYLTKKGVTVNSYKGLGVQNTASNRIAIVTVK
jgi:outer membrane protein OmpA-like peptidoglycan-associated protein